LSASVVRFTHVPVQVVRGGAQPFAQAPAAQIVPLGQALPHEPQLAASEAVFTSQPSDGS
jgi:hypothetical protein